jgi:rRNA maturation endonuclease Nob1
VRWEVQTALISAVGIVLSAGLSATAVIVTQQLAEGRSERERQRSRAAEEARRRDERTQEADRREATRIAEREAHERELEERWRDERRDAHTRMLAALDAIWTPANRFMSGLFTMKDDQVPERASFPLASEEHQTELSEAQSVVELIASPDAVRAVRDAARAARSITWMAPTARYEVSTYRTRRDEYYSSLDQYMTAARRELGVEGSAPSAPDAPTADPLPDSNPT